MRKEVTRVCNLSSSRWRRRPRRRGINVVNQDFIFEGEGKKKEERYFTEKEKGIAQHYRHQKRGGNKKYIYFFKREIA